VWELLTGAARSISSSPLALLLFLSLGASWLSLSKKEGAV